MPQRIDFYFDFGSPTAYLAWTRLPGMARDNDAELVYHPVLLGGIFQATGNASPMTNAAKAAYMTRDLERFAHRYRVPLAFNPHFPINTLTLMRMATGVQHQQRERFPELMAALFSGMWVESRDLGDGSVLRQTLERHRFDPDALLAIAADETVKTRLKEATAAAVERGLFGLPAIFVNDEMFWGQDRLDFVQEALEAGR
ncbi:2-hydroxychromene-2-carboxylate isomerase [Algiphilus sp.]|uniref:2-hydroxychromene-2-carboxylate isomerase n=1 Tax=Algiphilus sp. TaxID=1872431 RepID=UPI0025BB7E04|nr:2-hydroxychromene-2-carboxylate isomerase [Algiphilus sp.]MCK5772127.1 2-hydroxychromene-2-carboxylate isomerase [Algiphilus sp.]